MKKKKWIFLIPAVCILLPFALTACNHPGDSAFTGSPEDTEPQSETVDTAENEEKDSEAEYSAFGSIPWFRDDTGSRTQMADGWIYGYWGRRLCRINIDTLEAETLYEAASSQDGCFCIQDGYIYFLEKRNIDYLDGAKANLRRIKCDGSDMVLLAENIPVQEYQFYRMNFHEDILYLTSAYSGPEDDLYFRISMDGTASPVDVSDTLYGLLPEGYTDACKTYKYNSLPDIASCMTHFGYAFVTDSAGRLYRILPESGEKEEFPLTSPESSGYFFLTNEALVYKQDGDIWYAASLDHPETVTEIGELVCYGINFWDEKGMYYANQRYDEDAFHLERLNWDGTGDRLHYGISRPTTSLSADGLDFFYSDGTWLYYNRLHQGDSAVYRVQIENDSDCLPELVYVYYDNPLRDISVSETFDTTFTVNESGAKGSFSMTKVSLTEQTPAAAGINQFLETLYEEQSHYIEELAESVRETVSWEWPEDDWASGTIVEHSTHFSISYLDDNYIVLSRNWYGYWQGAAHGLHGTIEYVFSRSTGKQLQITDVVKNSEAEIKAIIGPYVEAQAEWGTDGEDWEAVLLEDGRFFLTPEGIGMHFDVYEMTSYASGGLDVIVPYEEFEMR
ncbi:DUF3298 domain-containing protein [Acetatifactor muris]|uniref:DUF3298 domain-containing protein n=1 Tax=Acetatifactor muris TaxID=879566 RepID=UPI0023F4C40B|nr:DUF3298 domain-containing protein [Acetatifactor muris]